MGFSVSASAAILLIAFLVSGSTIIGTIYNIGDSYIDSQKNYERVMDERAQTKITITKIAYDQPSLSLRIEVVNLGDTSLDANKNCILIDGRIVGERPTRPTKLVDDRGHIRRNSEEVFYWLPGEKITYNIKLKDIDMARGSTVKVITQNGISEYGKFEREWYEVI